MLANSSNVKSLVKILIGAAWLDGRIQPEERQYLYQVAKAKGVDKDPEIHPLLYELRPVQPNECYDWVQEYLGDRPSSEECQNLMEALSGLIYSDGEVAIEEAKLLTKLQQLSQASDSHHQGQGAMLQQIQKLYRRWLAARN
jgi:hypothetical protein